MIAVILFQINILTLTLFSLCGGKKKNYDGDGDVSLVQPGIQKASTPLGGLNGNGNGGMFPVATASSSASKPLNDDFSVGVPPPHIPLADKSDERTLADIESIQSEKAIIREKKSKASGTSAGQNSTPKIKNSGSKSPEIGVGKVNSAEAVAASKKMKGSRSPAH